MKSALVTTVVIISTLTINIVGISRAYSQTRGNQSSKLVTEPATINNKWNEVQVNSGFQSNSFSIRDPECKKINTLDYFERPEKFFKSCISSQDLQSKNYEPIEYLKVPGLDSGLSVTVTNF
ncbi:MAG: hypothetical protein F6K62_20775 [Sphaerospermopsis sp. SIO1G2]|nr:hypothetical protein [Sphaerospermopsis sp. SIO1G1]NET73275.1 hypothetical protein [Sphaerospermopsis sp. SIO1G2]